MVGAGAGEIGAVPMTALAVQVRQVPARVAARATGFSVLPVVAARAVAGTLQVRVVPSRVTPAGRVPIVASSRTSLTSRVIEVPAAGIATLPVLRADRV